MTRAQWLFVCATAAVACIAYIRSDQIARRLGILDTPILRKPSEYAI